MSNSKLLKLGRSFEAAFSPDGTLLAVVGTSVSLWNVRERRKLFSARPFSHPSSLAFAPSGKFVAIKNTSGRIATVESTSGRILRDFENHAEGEGAGVAISTDGRYIIDGSWGGILTMRDAKTGAVKFRSERSGTMVLQIAWLKPTRSWLVHRSFVSSDAEGPPDVFEVYDGMFTDVPRKTWKTHTRFIRRWALSTDGSQLAVVSGAPPIDLRILDVSTFRTTARAKIATGGSEDGLCWIGRDKVLLAERQRFALRAVRRGRLEELAAVAAEYPSSVAVSPSLDFVALCAWDGGRVIRLNELTTTHKL